MKISFKIIILIMSFSWMNCLMAQEKNQNMERFNQKAADSLFTEISNTIYDSFYTSSYMSTTNSTFTVLKIDINKQGKVTGINFSDSANSTFVKAYTNRKKWHDDTATLEKYAKMNSYTDVSLLIPVSFEPNYPYQKKVFSYDELESMMKFDKKNFTGKSILFSLIRITVLPHGNM
jgi:hypothetical protein